MNEITDIKLKKYFRIAEEALGKAKESKEGLKLENLKKARAHFLDTAGRYISDAKHFLENDDKVNAFAALNYAHGWLDAGVKLGIFDVKDDRLFAGVEVKK